MRQTLDYTSASRALGVCPIGWLVQAPILVFAAQRFGLARTEAV